MIEVLHSVPNNHIRVNKMYWLKGYTIFTKMSKKYINFTNQSSKHDKKAHPSAPGTRWHASSAWLGTLWVVVVVVIPKTAFPNSLEAPRYAIARTGLFHGCGAGFWAWPVSFCKNESVMMYRNTLIIAYAQHKKNSFINTVFLWLNCVKNLSTAAPRLFTVVCTRNIV